MKMLCRIKALAHAYMTAKQYVIDHGYDGEVDYQADADFGKVDEATLLREAAWVILNSGMRESIIRKLWGAISAVFYNWESASRISKQRKQCISMASRHFNHVPKLSAIVDVADHVSEHGLAFTKNIIEKEPETAIKKFSFIGKTTYLHLVKNLGIQTSKPDRHLRRLAQQHGYESPELLCRDIAKETGDKISVIDIVLWRICSLGCNYKTLEI